MTFDPIESFAASRHEFGEHGGVNMSIEASTTFTVMDAGIMPEIFKGRLGPGEQSKTSQGCYLYSRHFNPTVYVLGRSIAALEGAEAGYCTASGMSAIACSIMQLCSPGDEVVCSNTVYGGTFALFKELLPAKTGIRTRFVDIRDLDAVERAMSSRTRVLYTETVSNPTLVISDIPRLAQIAHEHDARLIVDNTFSPMIFSPIQLGADVVVHSLTKFINGASDIIAGAICSTSEFLSELMDLHTGALMLLGPTMDPQTAFQISLRLPHLGLRICEHSRRAMHFATRLKELGLEVNYPGLSTHPQHDLFRLLSNEGFGAGGLFTLDLGTREAANEFMTLLQNKYRFGYMAVSLGYFDTLMSASASSTSSEMSDEDLRAAGIAPGLVRISIGYTGSLEHRWHQFESALRDVGMA